MAVGVVDLLEAVQVKHERGDRIAMALGARDFRLQVFGGEAPVVQFGHRIDAGGPLKNLGPGFQF